MKSIINKLIFSFVFLFAMSIHSFASMGAIISYLLSDTISINTPTATVYPPSQTNDNNISLEINGLVGSSIYINGIDSGTIGVDGTLTINFPLIEGSNTFTIILRDSNGNESQALEFSITRVGHFHTI